MIAEILTENLEQATKLPNKRTTSHAQTDNACSQVRRSPPVFPKRGRTIPQEILPTLPRPVHPAPQIPPVPDMEAAKYQRPTQISASAHETSPPEASWGSP